MLYCLQKNGVKLQTLQHFCYSKKQKCCTVCRKLAQSVDSTALLLLRREKVLYCLRISWFLRFRKGAFNRGPKGSKRSPPGGPNEPQARPGRPQERPKSPQHGSKSRPERAKRRPRKPRSAPGDPKPPRRFQGALREPILTSSWGPRGLIFEPSRRPFRASRAVR